jgi:hypothetical protein
MFRWKGLDSKDTSDGCQPGFRLGRASSGRKRTREQADIAARSQGEQVRDGREKASLQIQEAAWLRARSNTERTNSSGQYKRKTHAGTKMRSSGRVHWRAD